MLRSPNQQFAECSDLSGGIVELESADDVALADKMNAGRKAIIAELQKQIVGQAEVIELVLLTLFVGGNSLIVGVPGLAKTLLIATLAKVVELKFNRIQFTPDLMPSEITGGIALLPDEQGHTRATYQAGPIFTQLLLADEINRATPKTQSALLEAMQERTVTAAGRSMPLPRPFFVLATQNPIEMEGTYQLPEAQIDRFLFKSVLAFPSEEELDSILDLTTGAAQAVPAQVLTVDDILAGQRLVRSVPIASHVRRAVARFVRRTQLENPDVTADVKRYIRFGISPRGAQSLVLAAKGHALLRHRYNVSFGDLRAVLRPTLRHRFQLNFEGEADQVDAEALLTRLFEDAIRDSA